MIATPAQAIAAPITSNISGTIPSKIKPQSNAMTINIPSILLIQYGPNPIVGTESL